MLFCTQSKEAFQSWAEAKQREEIRLEDDPQSQLVATPHFSFEAATSQQNRAPTLNRTSLRINYHVKNKINFFWLHIAKGIVFVA
jgi:hypothetical protein